MTVDDPQRRQRGADGALAESTRRAERSDHSHWNWLLLIPLFATLYPPLYNKIDPELNGWPFFYWFQMALIPFATVLTVIAFALSRIADRKDREARGQARDQARDKELPEDLR